MRPHVHATSASGFRKNMARWMRRAEAGDHVFLARHGRSRCCLVSMADAQLLYDLHGRSLEEYMHRAQMEYERWLTAKMRAEGEWDASLGLGGWYNPSPAMVLAREMWESEQRHKRRMELIEEVEAESGGGDAESWDPLGH